MDRVLKAFTMILVMTVFLGIAMDFSLILSHPGNKPVSLSTKIMQAFQSVIPEKGWFKAKGPRLPMGEKDRKLKLNAETISLLRSDYGTTVNNPQMQVQILERMEQYLTSEFPQTWHGRMQEALKTVFPDKADQLMQMFRKLDSYNVWVDKNWERLLGMKMTERDNILWEKRNEIFGNEAHEIWQGELKADAIYRILDVLNKVKGSPLEEELDFFVKSIRQAYGVEADTFISNHQQELLDSFLGLDSVQSALKAMQPQKERQSLKAIRKAFGMSEGELARWEELDKLRDEQWAKGLDYVKEHQRIVGTTKGEAQGRMLNELREKYFNTDADIIANEEGAGFFRFGGKRVYGKN